MDFLKFITSKLFLKHLGIAAGIFVGVMLIVMIWLRIYTHHGMARSVPSFRGLTIEAAKNLAVKNKLRIQISDSVFLRGVEKGSIVTQNPDAGFKVKVNRTIFLTINAFSVPKTPMPDIVGTSTRQAQAILEAKGLKIGKLIYVPDFAQNNVLEQRFEGNTILEGQMVEKGAAIDVVVGRGYSDQLTSVPRLVNKVKTKAEREIVNLYLNMGATIYDETVQNFEDSLNACVYKQIPEPGRKVNLGSFVDVWLTLDSIKLAVADSLVINNDPTDEIY